MQRHIYGYAVQVRQYQGAKKGKQVASSAKWELGVVLRLMERLTLTVSFDILWMTISHLFFCLRTMELTAFEQQLCLTKIDYVNALSAGTKSCKKRNIATLNSAHQAEK